MHVYVLEHSHSQPLLQNHVMDFETWHKWRTQGPIYVLWHFGQILQGGAKIGYVGLLFQKTSSSDRKATSTNRMYSNDLEARGKKCCYFWFQYKV